MVLVTKCSISTTCLRFAWRRLIGLFWLGLLFGVGCISPSEPSALDPQNVGGDQQVDHWLECPRIATYRTFNELVEALPRHFKDEGGTELLVIGFSVYGNPCSPTPRIGGSGEQARVVGSGEQARVAGSGEQPRIGGSGEQARVAGSGEQARVAGSGEQSRIGGSGEQARVAGSGEQARVAGSGEQSRIGGSGEQARVAGSGEQARIAGSGEQPRIGGSGEQARVAGSGEQARIAGSGEQPRIGGSTEQSRVAGSGEKPRVAGLSLAIRCAVVRSAVGYLIDNHLGTPVYIFDGAQLWQLIGNHLIQMKGELANEQTH